MHVISRIALLGALLLLPAACSSGEDFGKVPLACPTVGVLSDASALRVFGDGTGRDQANTAYELEFMRAHLLECKLKEGEMTATIRFEARARTGPAAPSNEYEYPYFVALLNPDGEVISKDLRKGTVKFKSGKTEAFFAQEYEDIEFTVPEGKDGLGFEILIGFQLTREQIELKRAQDAAPKSGPDLIMQE